MSLWKCVESKPRPLGYTRARWKFVAWPTTDVKLGTSDRCVGTRTAAHWYKSFFVAAHDSMDIGGSIWVCCRSVHWSIGCDQESFTLVWRWHKLLSRSLPNSRLSRVSHRLLARSRTFHFARMLPPMHMEPRAAPNKLHHTRCVAVTPAAVRFLFQRPIVSSFP